jgi:hypothetical protein
VGALAVETSSTRGAGGAWEGAFSIFQTVMVSAKTRRRAPVGPAGSPGLGSANRCSCSLMTTGSWPAVGPALERALGGNSPRAAPRPRLPLLAECAGARTLRLRVITQGETTTMVCDIFDKTTNALFEAKGSAHGRVSVWRSASWRTTPVSRLPGAGGRFFLTVVPARTWNNCSRARGSPLCGGRRTDLPITSTGRSPIRCRVRLAGIHAATGRHIA